MAEPENFALINSFPLSFSSSALDLRALLFVLAFFTTVNTALILRSLYPIAWWTSSYVVFDSLPVIYLLVQSFAGEKGLSAANSYHEVIPLAVGVTIYYSVRLVPRQVLGKTRRIVVLATACGGLWLGIQDINLFIQSRPMLDLFPSGAIVSVRAFIPLVGGPLRSDALALVVLLIPLTAASILLEFRAKSCLVAFPCFSLLLLAVVAILSLSRAVFISSSLSTILFLWILLHYRLVSVHTAIAATLAGVVVLLCIVFVSHLNRPILETISLFSSGSQRRSALGRTILWKQYLILLKQRPLAGFGACNDGMLALRMVPILGDIPVTSQAYNLYLDIAIQSGLLGACTFAVFIGGLISRIASCLRSKVVALNTKRLLAILTAGLAGVLLYGFAFSSFDQHPPTMIVAWLLFGLIGGTVTADTIPDNYFAPLNIVIPGFGLLILTTAIGLRGWRLVNIESIYRENYQTVARGEYVEALRSLDSLDHPELQSATIDAARGLILTLLVLPHSLVDPNKMGEALSEQQRGQLAQALVNFNLASQKAPFDATLISNVGALEILLDDQNAGWRDLSRAMALSPRDPAIHVLLGMLADSRGQNEAALNDYADAVASWPRIVDSQFYRDLVMRSPREGADVLARAVTILSSRNESPIRDALIAKIDLAIGRRAQAKKLLNGAVAQLPTLAYGWSNLGLLQSKDGNSGEALRSMERAARFSMRDTQACDYLASHAMEAGDLGSAQYWYGCVLASPIVSDHAARSRLVYQLPSISEDDLVPTGLLAYISPIVNTEGACLGLAQISSHLYDTASIDKLNQENLFQQRCVEGK